MFSIAAAYKKEELPEFAELNKNHKFASTFFGAPADTGLDGGREFFCGIPLLSSDEVASFVSAANECGIGFRFTFTSTLPEQNELDRAAKLLEHTNNKLNGVTCTTMMVRDFVRSNFPKLHIVASRIFNKTDVDFLRDLCDEFDMMILPEQLNHDIELIRQLPVKKIELILNSYCHKECNNRDLHYRLNSIYAKKIMDHHKNKDMLNKLRMEFTKELAQCGSRTIKDIDCVRIEPKDIQKYIDLGVRNFKLLDRRDPPTAMLVKEYINQLSL